MSYMNVWIYLAVGAGFSWWVLREIQHGQEERLEEIQGYLRKYPDLVACLVLVCTMAFWPAYVFGQIRRKLFPKGSG